MISSLCAHMAQASHPLTETAAGEASNPAAVASLSVGARVIVSGRGLGVIDVDNEDGTWNVSFDDDSEADIYQADIEVCEGLIGDQLLGSADADALVIWLHGCTDTPDGWHHLFKARCSTSLPHVRFSLPCAPMQFLSRAGKRTTSWFDIKSLPMKVASADPGTGQRASIERVLRMIDSAVKAGIPPSRIVVGGHSQGGALALAAVLQATVPIAACVVYSGWALPSQNLGTLIASSRAVIGGTRFLVSHGDQDSTVLPECGTNVARLLEEGGCSCGDTLDVRVFRGMGHCTRGVESEEMDMLLDFFTRVLPA